MDRAAVVPKSLGNLNTLNKRDLDNMEMLPVNKPLRREDRELYEQVLNL